ncbi:MAG TPA: ABC transporter permease [Anaerolineae bacterium]
MNKILTVARHEFLTLVTKPSFWIALIGLPLFMGVVMAISLLGSGAASAATIASKQNEVVIQGYVDKSGLIKTMPPGVSMQPYPDEAAAQAALNSSRINGYFVVPADYIASGKVTYISPEFSPVNSPTGQFEQVLKYNLVGGDMSLLQRAGTDVTVQNSLALAPKDTKGGAGAPFPLLPMFAGILFMIVMITASSYMMQTVTTEKETRVMEVLMSSITPRQMLTGKIIGFGMVGFVQMALWLLSSLGALAYIPAAASLGSVTAGSVVVAVIYFVLGFFIYASLMAGLGALMPGSREAAQYTFFIILPLIIPMYVSTALLYEPNGALAVILSLIPFTSPVVMVMRITATDVPLYQIIAGIVLLAVTVVIVINVVARLFRAQSLLSGSKPSIKDIVLALK